MAKFSMAKRPAIALGAAAVAVLGAAGISQAQGGTTATTPSATTPGQHGGPGRGPGGPGGPGAGPRGDRAAALAKALGVSTDKLQAAIESLRSSEDRPDPKADRTAEVKALADALGSDSATITKVLEAQRPAGGPKGTPPTPPTGTTPPAPPTGGTTPPAPPTGTTPDKGPQGTTPGKKGGAGGHGGPRGGGFPGGPGGGPGRGGLGGPAGADNAALVTALAKATSKSEADVKSALTKLAAERKADHEAAETAYAKKLADKLGLDASKVEDAIESLRPTPPAKGTTPAPTTPAPTTP